MRQESPSSAPASPPGTANGAPPGTHTGLPWRETRGSPGGVPSSLAWSPRPRNPAPFTEGTPSTGTHAESDSPGACPGPATKGRPSGRPAESKEARGATHARVPGRMRRWAHRAATSPPPPSAGPHLPRPRHRAGDRLAFRPLQPLSEHSWDHLLPPGTAVRAQDGGCRLSHPWSSEILSALPECSGVVFCVSSGQGLQDPQEFELWLSAGYSLRPTARHSRLCSLPALPGQLWAAQPKVVNGLELATVPNASLS